MGAPEAAMGHVPRPPQPRLSVLLVERGTSLIEVLVGSLIGAVLVTGLMAAFLTALRITSVGQGNTEAAALAQQTLERFRNRIACDTGWFNAPCAPGALPSNVSDPLSPGALYNTGTRKYTVTSADCDGVGGPGDCFKVVAKVSWTQPR